MQKLKTSDVFTTAGLPRHTYVRPPQFGNILIAMQENGKHLLIEGPSGIGKTCAVFKALEELNISDEEYDYISCRDSDHLEKIDSALKSALNVAGFGRVYIIDDFHMLVADKRKELGDSLKRVSDNAFRSGTAAKFILVGIPTAGESLLYDAKDLGPRLGLYKFSAVGHNDIVELIREGEDALNIVFADKGAISVEASGNFWLAQHICQRLCVSSSVLESQQNQVTIPVDIGSVRDSLIDELYSRYKDVVVNFAKGKKWRPGGNKPYLDIVTAIAKQGEPVLTFDTIRNLVHTSRKAGVNAVRQRIPEVIFDADKNVDIRKQLFFDPVTGNFSIEDPLFLYFLRHLDLERLHKDLGLDPQSPDEQFEYDIIFSFSGMVRKIVECVNSQLSGDDVVTFYDFDHQAYLLGTDLEQYFKDLYSRGGKYYLIFADSTYVERVWPSFEKDNMTAAERTGHIIPIILENGVASNMVGIKKTIGHIDISDIYLRINATGTLTEVDKQELYDRVVMPVLDKLTS